MLLILNKIIFFKNFIEAHRKSQSARQTITNSAPILQQSEQLRKLTSKMLDDASLSYHENKVNNDGALSAIRRDIASLEKQIPEVNSLVCDGNSTVDNGSKNFCK